MSSEPSIWAPDITASAPPGSGIPPAPRTREGPAPDQPASRANAAVRWPYGFARTAANECVCSALGCGPEAKERLYVIADRQVTSADGDQEVIFRVDEFGR